MANIQSQSHPHPHPTSPSQRSEQPHPTARPTGPIIPDSKLNVVFVHLDLGIGGAEQLVLQLATASQSLGHNVQLVTTRCDDDHCFQAFSKSQNGRLANNVYIYGNWIPPSVMGLATALMSTLRMLFLTWQLCRNHRHAHVVVVDVLPTSLPMLLFFMPSAAIFFYCHFPDKLLLRTHGGSVKKLYRFFLDGVEELTMGLADLLVVNSKFTRETVKSTFTSLPPDMPVLYPALDISNLVKPNNKSKNQASPIVSLNRFERKKNIALLIRAYHYLQETYPEVVLPPLIIAGGYDTQNVENVEHRAELQSLVDQLQVPGVQFLLDISDEKRATLFQTALCVVYTPDKEHFGIVPLEAMYAGTPVLAVNSGGPTETVLDGTTGFLRSPTPKDFGEALLELIQDPSKATTMGKAGRQHVENRFGTKLLEREWQHLLQETLHRRNMGRPNHALWNNVGLYFSDALFAIIAVIAMTSFLQWLGCLQQGESIVGGLRRTMNGGEL